MRRVAILGASGHGKVVADAARLAGWGEIAFFDDRCARGERMLDWQVEGDTADLLRQRGRFEGAVVAIGDNRTRLEKHRVLEAAGVKLVTVVHPAAVISKYAELGPGTVVFAGGIVNPSARLGVSCIVNTAASIDHDCELGGGVHVSPGARIGGGVRIGEGTWVGIGAAVRHGVRIGAHVMVGGGAMVIADVDDGATVTGVPARTRAC